MNSLKSRSFNAAPGRARIKSFVYICVDAGTSMTVLPITCSSWTLQLNKVP